ncbi:hypothetical protein [Cellulomonas sp.]|uniref:hypothetical protein n=1 Tax=Cellulomonas sp. TaxID=40001 RepID=UPI001AFF665A|nr:hypothetical protein [Cellulomonas sp.]MBO9555590.1 hypothetical protein [Cellulomonas sp.]
MPEVEPGVLGEPYWRIQGTPPVAEVFDALAAAGLLTTPERLAQERAAALGEAADEVDLDPAITGGLSEHHNAEAAAETWLRARAEAERAGGGA